MKCFGTARLARRRVWAAAALAVAALSVAAPGPFEAACAGAYVHGRAAESWSEGAAGDRGLLAHEIADQVPGVLAWLTTFTAGLRSGGPVAPLVLDEPMNGEAFLVYVEGLGPMPVARRYRRDRHLPGSRASAP